MNAHPQANAMLAAANHSAGCTQLMRPRRQARLRAGEHQVDALWESKEACLLRGIFGSWLVGSWPRPRQQGGGDDQDNAREAPCGFCTTSHRFLPDSAFSVQDILKWWCAQDLPGSPWTYTNFGVQGDVPGLALNFGTEAMRVMPAGPQRTAERCRLERVK